MQLNTTLRRAASVLLSVVAIWSCVGCGDISPAEKKGAKQAVSYQHDPAGGGAVTRLNRAAAIAHALASGDAEKYEESARLHFTSEFFASGTSTKRAEFVRKLKDEFGRIEILDIVSTDEGVRAGFSGEVGPTGFFVFSFAEGESGLIDNLGVQVGGGAEGGEIKLPPLPIDATMAADAMARAIDDWMAPMLAHEDFAGVILITRDGEKFVQLAYGKADRANGVDADPSIAYNLASIGKKFTHVAVGRLIQEGRLASETTVGEVLPDYPNGEAMGATVDQLINHRGGVSDFFGPEFDAEEKSRFKTNHDYYEYVGSLPHLFSPGSRSEYCNGCYIVLGEMVERISGVSFEDFIVQHVFAPAGMSHSGYFRMDQPSPTIARSYTRPDGPGGDYIDAEGFHGVAGSAAGGVYATATDLAAFDKALRDGALLDSERTAWVLGADETDARGRNVTPLGIAGGAHGVNAAIESGGEWGVFVVANVDPPIPAIVASKIAERLTP